MDLIIFLFAMEFGYSPMNISRIDTEIDNRSGLFDIQLEPEFVLFDFVHVGGKADIKMLPGKRTFYPISIESTFNLSAEYKGFEIGFEHLCIHPIIPGGAELFYQQIYDEAENRFYIRYDSGAK